MKIILPKAQISFFGVVWVYAQYGSGYVAKMDAYEVTNKFCFFDV